VKKRLPSNSSFIRKRKKRIGKETCKALVEEGGQGEISTILLEVAKGRPRKETGVIKREAKKGSAEGEKIAPQ